VYVAAPSVSNPHPGLVLMHSSNGLEPGYREMCDRIAGDGFVVIAPEWQTYAQRAGDDEIGAVLLSYVDVMRNRSDVDSTRLGLTRFYAGGRHTMPFLPQVEELGAGVVWHGIPFSAGYSNIITPAEHIDGLERPMLMIHGPRDRASNITDINNYSRELNAADRYFELKVYQ
jgi:carboxymethylenebutenolidase